MIEVNDLQKFYEDFSAVSSLTFNVYPGEIFGIIGPNGAGKTTLIKLLMGMVKPGEGVVRGSRVRAVHLGKDIRAFFKGIVGGDVSDYSKLMEDTRDYAVNDMVKEAEKLGANAIIGIRFSSSQITSGSFEIMVYGTAIKI